MPRATRDWLPRDVWSHGSLRSCGSATGKTEGDWTGSGGGPSLSFKLLEEAPKYGVPGASFSGRF